MSYGSFASNYNSPMASLGEAVGAASNKAGGMFGQFRNNKVVSGTTDFLYSNTLVAKVCFFILVLIIFVYALRLGTIILGYLTSPEKNPILVNGLKSGKKKQTIHQDPKTYGSKPILRSVNERDGLEFTWSVWLFIDDLVYRSGNRKHIFNKGSDANIGMKQNFDGVNVSDMAFPNNAPGLYLHETKY